MYSFSDIIHDFGLYIPNNPDMTDEEIQYICNIINIDDLKLNLVSFLQQDLICKYILKNCDLEYSTQLVNMSIPLLNAQMVEKLNNLSDRLEVLPDRLLMYTESGEELLAKISALNIHPNTSLVRRSSLEDVFLRLTGRTLIE
jgi:hypothetical protein